MINMFKNLPSEVKKSIAEQGKLLSWVLGGINGYFMNSFGRVGGVLFIILWWVLCQTIAHTILYHINNNKNKEEK